MDEDKISVKNWMSIWLLGFIGQLCWNVENVWFNNFVYDKIAKDPSILTWMSGVSAVASTIATFVIGTWSDRKGKRRTFIFVGYTLWGLFTIIFGAAEFLPKSSLFIVVSFIILADAVMSFFGSSGYDAGYQSWTTDISTERNRGKLGGALATLPVAATIFGAAVSGIIIEKFDYFVFFIIIGCIVMIMGLLSLIMIKDSPSLKPRISQPSFIKQLAEVFKWSTVVQNKELFWVFILNAIFSSCFNIYFPYLTIYFNNYLGYSLDLAGIILAVALILSLVVIFPAAKAIDKGHVVGTVCVAITFNVLGLIAVVLIPNAVPFIILATFMVGVGYILMNQTLAAWLKNLFPTQQRGQFEGVRMIFIVCFPMIIGPNISNIIITKFGVYMTIDNVSGMVPNQSLFLWAACLTVLAFLPVIPANKWNKKRLNKGE